MKLIEIVQLIEAFQKEQYYPEIVYLLSKNWIQTFINSVKFDNQQNIPMKPINHDIVDETKSNVLQYQDDIYNSFLKDNLRRNVDYIYISQQIWSHLNSLYDGYCIKRQLRNLNQINEFIIFTLSQSTNSNSTLLKESNNLIPVGICPKLYPIQKMHYKISYHSKHQNKFHIIVYSQE